MNFITDSIFAMWMVIMAFFGMQASDAIIVPIASSTIPVSTTTVSQPAKPTTPVVEKPVSRMHIITRDQNGTSVTVRVGDQVIFKLPETEEWTLVSSDTKEAILYQLRTFAATPGIQASYSVNAVGTVVISGDGRTHCDSGQICAMYLIPFSVTIRAVK